MVEHRLVKLGALERTYRIRRRISWLFLVLFMLGTSAVVYFLVRYVDAPVCAGVPLFILGWVAVEFFIKRRTEFRIYARGCAYQRLFKRHEIFWDEVEEFGHVLREDYLRANLRDVNGDPLPKAASVRHGDWVWIQTGQGEKFYLRPDLENIKDIIDQISIKLYGDPYYGALEFGADYQSETIRRNIIDA